MRRKEIKEIAIRVHKLFQLKSKRVSVTTALLYCYCAVLHCTAVQCTVLYCCVTYLYSKTAVMRLCIASSRSWGRLVARNTMPSCRSISVSKLLAQYKDCHSKGEKGEGEREGE